MTRAMKMPEAPTPSGSGVTEVSKRDGSLHVEGVPGFAGVVHVPPKSKPRQSRDDDFSDMDGEVPAVRIESPASGPEKETGNTVPVDLVDPSPDQPRLHFDQSAIESLAENIQAIGLFSPISVRPKGDGRFFLIAGERRLRAAKLLGWKDIPAVIREQGYEKAKIECYIENLGREDLVPFEGALIVKEMLDSGMAKSQREVSRMTTLTEGSISMYMSYFKLPSAALSVVRSNPPVLGLREAYELSRLAQEHPEAVTEAIRFLNDGRINSGNLVRWVNDRIAGRKRRAPDSPFVVTTKDGKEVCNLARNAAGKIVITAKSSVDDFALEQAIQKALTDFFAGEADARDA